MKITKMLCSFICISVLAFAAFALPLPTKSTSSPPSAEKSAVQDAVGFAVAVENFRFAPRETAVNTNQFTAPQFAVTANIQLQDVSRRRPQPDIVPLN